MVVSALVVAGFSAVPSFATASLFKSPDTDLTYLYESRTTLEAPDGRVKSFSMGSAHGTLRADVTFPNPISIHIRLSETGQEVTITGAPTREPGVTRLHFEWSSFGTMDIAFSADGDYTSISSIRDCDGLATSPLYLALVETMGRTARDIAAKTTPPSHELQVFNVLATSALLPRAIEGCREQLKIGGCIWKAGNWSECKECCETNNPDLVGSALAVMCGWAARKCGGTPMCMGGAAVCGAAAASLDQAGCISRSCGGKPGDPLCHDPKPPCEDLEARCQGSCWSGQTSRCGYCPTDSQPACCSD